MRTSRRKIIKKKIVNLCNIHFSKNKNNICQIGYHLNNGLNKQEVVTIPKTIEKKGFFEKLFHLFK